MTFRPFPAAAAIALACLSSAVAAGPTEAQHAAACVAALKAQEGALVETMKAGEPVEPVLLKVVRSGIAIIGTQYLAGLREGEARELLKIAEHDFAALPRSAAEERQAACLQEGESLFQHASVLERNLITMAAQRRIKRLTST